MKRFKAIIILFVIAISSAVAGTLLACSAPEGELPIEQLAAPENFIALDDTVRWDEVEGASGYSVELNGVSERTDDNYFAFDFENATKVQARVKALGNEVYNSDSEWSSISFTYERPTVALKYIPLADGSGYAVTRSGSVNAGLAGRVVIRDCYNGLPVKMIVDEAFHSNSLKIDYETGEDCNTVTTSFRLPALLEEIGNLAFCGCLALEETVLPQSVKKIGGGAFSYCRKLDKINLPESVKEIGNCAFEYTSLTEIVIPHGINIISGFCFNHTLLTKVDIPESVMRIGGNAFDGTQLTEIKIPESVVYIGSMAFQNCSKLDKVALPKNLEYLGNLAFRNTPFYNKYLEHEGFIIMRGDILCGYNGVAPTVIEEDDIPAEVKFITNGALGYDFFEGLKVIKFRDDITFWDDVRFYGKDSLEEVKLPASMTEIPYEFFEGCHSLKKVTMPKNVTKISEDAFWACYALENIVISDSVTRIGRNAFGYCESLSAVYYEGTEEQWNQIDIDYNPHFPEYNVLQNVTKYFYVENEEDVPAEGNYWHYAPDGVTPLIWSK